MRFPGKSKSLVVAVHDGLAWRAYVLRRGHGEWACVGRTEEESRAGRGLPKTMLDFIAQSRARRLRVLLSGDVHAVLTELPEDASDEELHTALAYETQGELGLDAAGHRLAAARATLYEMGGDRKALLAAAFEIERLERLAAEAESEGVVFDGAGSLELAVLSAHAHRAPHRRLLLIRERTSFYAVPANDPQPFLTAMLPLGLDAAGDPTAKERAERARERLTVHDAVPLTVVLPGEVERLRERVSPYLGACADVEYVTLAELEEAALRMAVGGRLGGVTQACPWIGLPPRQRDPHRHGTIILFVILAVALAWAGLRKQELERDLRAARASLAAWKTLEAARKQASDKSKALRDRQSALSAKRAMLEERHCLPRGLVPLLGTLAENMPPYSALVSVRQRAEGGVEIAGLTRWQDGLTKLDAALRELGAREGMRREFGGLETIEGQNAQRFRFTIHPGEDRP
jgi:Tfp pilus assembly protein PilN